MDEPGHRGPGTVLLAEHQAIVGIWLEDVLADAGYVVDGPHPTCEDALRALARSRPDYAVVSVDLRQGRCFALACALRRVGVPFMLLSGSVPVPQAFSDVPVVGRPCLGSEIVASLPRASAIRRTHRRGLAACRRPMLRIAPPAFALDQCPPACGA